LIGSFLGFSFKGKSNQSDVSHTGIKSSQKNQESKNSSIIKVRMSSPHAC